MLHHLQQISEGVITGADLDHLIHYAEEVDGVGAVCTIQMLMGINILNKNISKFSYFFHHVFKIFKSLIYFVSMRASICVKRMFQKL